MPHEEKKRPRNRRIREPRSEESLERIQYRGQAPGRQLNVLVEKILRNCENEGSSPLERQVGGSCQKCQGTVSTRD